MQRCHISWLYKFEGLMNANASNQHHTLINQEIPVAILRCAKWSKRICLPTSQLMNNVVYFIFRFVHSYWMPELELVRGPLCKISEINIGLFVFRLRGICGCHLDLVFTASPNACHHYTSSRQSDKPQRCCWWYMNVDIMAIYNNVTLFLS